MSDVTLSPQAIGLISGMMATLVAAITALCTAIIVLYRQVLKERDERLTERDRVLNEKDARLIDAWKDNEENKVRIVALEAANERLQKLAADATEGWRESMRGEAGRRASNG